jgi:integrase
VAGAISGYRPYSVPDAAALFAREMVARVNPKSPERARALLWATSKLAEFSIACGLELSAEVVFHPSVIERFCSPGATRFSAPARRTLRGHLRFVAKQVVGGVSPCALERERAKAPYSRSEIDSYLSLADSQPTDARRMHAIGLICLGAGAGLVGSDLRHVRGHHVKTRFGGVVVEVTGRNLRTVPVISRYHEHLLESACFSGDGYLIGGQLKDRKNVTTPLIGSLAGGADLERLSTRRLRSTWLCECADAIGLKAFMDAAGVCCTQRLGDLISHLDPGDGERAMEILGRL